MKGQTYLNGRAMALNGNRIRVARFAGAHGGHGSIGNRLRALLLRGDEGSALVEIALTVPMLLTVLTAICVFGGGFNNQLRLTSAVGAGAQYLQAIRTTTSDPCADTLTAIEHAAPSLRPSKINLTITMNGNSTTSNSCSGSQTRLSPGEPVTVTAKYPCAPAIYGTTFSTACQLSAKVTKYEY